MAAFDISPATRMVGTYNMAAPAANGTERGAFTGTPQVLIHGRRFPAAASPGVTVTQDSVTKAAAPTLNQGENMVVVHTLGFSAGDATTAPAQQNYVLFSGAKGTPEEPADVPVHVPDRHTVVAVELFENRGATPFTYGTTNFLASSDTGVKHERYNCATLPNADIWRNF